MTLEEIRNSDKPTLTPKDVADVLGCHPYVICVQAKRKELPFPCFRSGSRTKIPRVAFLRWMDGECAPTKNAAP